MWPTFLNDSHFSYFFELSLLPKWVIIGPSYSHRYALVVGLSTEIAGSLHTKIPQIYWHCSVFHTCDFLIQISLSLIRTWIYSRFMLQWFYMLSRHLFYVYLRNELRSMWTYFFLNRDDLYVAKTMSLKSKRIYLS